MSKPISKKERATSDINRCLSSTEPGKYLRVSKKPTGSRKSTKDKSSLVRSRCWYKFPQLVDWYRRRMKWASEENRPYDRGLKFKTSVYGFHMGLKILEHWDSFYKYKIFPNGKRQDEDILSLIEKINKRPTTPFAVIYENASTYILESKRNIQDSFDIAANVHPDAKARYEKYQEDKKKKRTFDSQMSKKGLRILAEEYKIVKNKGLDYQNWFYKLLTRKGWVFFADGKIPSD